jgi:esterase/lipase superfamily enzyme
MLVATTRRMADTPAELYTGERGPDLSFVDMTISIPPESVRKAGEVQWPESLPGNPATDSSRCASIR